MALDYLAFKRIIELIKNSVEKGKITKISQISNEEFLFIIRNDNQNYNLLISTHPNMSYLNIVNEKIASNHINTNLLMLFRKHLENGKVVSFEQQNDDRIVCMTITNRDDYYNNSKHYLYIELIGRASNLILTDSNNIIIDSLKKIPLEYSNLRTIQAGIHYRLPDKPQNETLPYDLENEIAYSHKSLDEIKEEINNSQYIYITTKNDKKDFHFIPFEHLEGSVEKFWWNIGLDKFYLSNLESERHRQFTSQMDKLAKNEIKRSTKKIQKLQEELQSSKDSIIFKYYGDLLLTYMQGVKINSEIVGVFDEFENKTVNIPFDTRYDVYHNANAYYKKYQKSKVAIIKIQEQIDLCQENIDYFESIRYHLERADIISAMQIKEELIAQGFYRKYKKPEYNTKKGKQKEKVYKPICYNVDGINIYVGQNNLQNEYLTFKMANKKHMFFHIKQGPGAHVVVFSDTIDEKTKRIAANIAAYYSSYKDSSTVAVNYTLVKNIKKIPGGKPGKVIIENYKTIYVDPDLAIFDQYKK